MDENLRYIPEPTVSREPSLPVESMPQPQGQGFLPSRKAGAVAFLAACALVIGLYAAFISSPADFASDMIYLLEPGQTLSGAAQDLRAVRIIRSPFAFKVLGRLFAPASGIRAGEYEFAGRQNAIVVAWRLARGSYDLTLERVTIPEGLSSAEIAALISKNPKFYRFDAAEFKKLAAPYEGYLFPDTYFLMPNLTAEELVQVMTDTYKRRIEGLSADIKAFGKPIEDVIVMASIIEREARTEESRRTIAGILWKRLSQGMPLQVDAAFAFVNGKKDSKDLTLDDLAIDSPYNTYANKGLPPGPIGNPGLAAIRATVKPLDTPYFFYLSDDSGVMHYSVTHDEHVANKDRYLR